MLKHYLVLHASCCWKAIYRSHSQSLLFWKVGSRNFTSRQWSHVLLQSNFPLVSLDERPYKCKKCGKSFRESGALTRHLKSLTPCTEKIRFNMNKEIVVSKEDVASGQWRSSGPPLLSSIWLAGVFALPLGERNRIDTIWHEGRMGTEDLGNNNLHESFVP